MSDLISKLPNVRGSYRANADLSKTNWFNVGGPAEVLFRPEDKSDLVNFLKNKPENIPITILGVGSNLLVRDGGLDGVVIKLGRNFAFMHLENNTILDVGAAALDFNVAHFALEHSLSGAEFLVGIPGTIGGALAMNAGAYGSDIGSILIEAEAVDEAGNLHILSHEDFGFVYRGNTLPEGMIFLGAKLQTTAGDKVAIHEKMQQICTAREESQPIKSKTSGSTFKNPPGSLKAWQLIDQAGMRGYRVGDAMVSEKHCNFFLNVGHATSSDIEKLGELVKAEVLKKTGVELVWEVKIIGKN